MNPSKEKLLNEAYQKFLDLGLSIDSSMDNLEVYIDKDVMGYGTTLDEKILSFSGFQELMHRQREQSEGLQMEWELNPVLRRVLPQENAAVYADDILLKITMAHETVEMRLRCSVVMEFKKDTWVVIHWHASKPEAVTSEEDTFGLEEWKTKNEALEKKVTEKTAQLQHSLNDLKATQAQLIQSEKMASLGELTAGIAHEIQNPLNFVNNFSEVSNEMIQEIKEERAKKKEERDEALEDELLKDIADNLQKISHHGKRADAIVKGMLLHSRSSSGVKEPTNINALADEYLRLSYHGLRAKDKFFNANFSTDFDESIGKISIVPQDIGRVIMNLVTNAFYAVNEKKAESLKQNAEGDVFEPKVSIITKKEGNQVLISVSDNGNGIPASVKEKIFQPFFTTKPTGKGTGLGLSLSYDIVKAHGGELSVRTPLEKVEKAEGEGTTFIITLNHK
jgi:signal transduction histidine kinase